jgi:hypothetical protein
MRALRLVSQLHPAQKIPGLGPGRLIPADLHSPQEPPPAQQGHPVRPLRRSRPPARGKIPEIGTSRGNHHAIGVDQLERLKQIPGRLKRTGLRHHQTRQLPRSFSSSDHGGRR